MTGVRKTKRIVRASNTRISTLDGARNSMEMEQMNASQGQQVTTRYLVGCEDGTKDSGHINIQDDSDVSQSANSCKSGFITALTRI